MAPVDPHSYTDSTHPPTTHISLTLYLDFPSSTIHASALFTLQTPHSGPFFLDTRSLDIHSITDPTQSTPIPFSLSPTIDPIKGSKLTLTLSNHTSFLITYTTSPSSSALQWLLPPQTFNKKHPFVYTQCQAIHARSVFPCQDTPAIRVCYSARLNIPKELTAVMAAKHVARRESLVDDECFGNSWQGRVVEEFEMELPIPPYLFAFAVGELDNREVGPRTRVYAESVTQLLDSAAKEFDGTEDMIREGERLFGNYEWERFDLLVLPPSFPYGGMENPRMVFLTPTVIKGDATGAQVVAHELAHSWTGNLITNKTNEHFWLNEGFTTYAERRIVEAVQGEKRALLNIGIGWRGLNEDVERFKDNMELTKLKNNQEGIDPDDVYSQVPYEKGFQFLLRIEREIGRPAFDEFLKKYIATFKFKSIDTETFIDFLKANIPGIENKIDLVLWTEGTGIEQFHSHQSDSSMVNQLVGSAFEKESQSRSEYHVESFVDDPVAVSSAVNETMLLQRKGGKSTTDTQSAKGLNPTNAHDKPGKSIDVDINLSNQARVSHLMESIEKGYVLINPHFTSLEDFSDYFEASASVQDNPSSGVSICPLKGNSNLDIGKQTKDPSSSSTDGLNNFKSNELDAFVASCEFSTVRKEREFSLLHPSNRLEMLDQYVQVLGELSQEKYNTGLYLESLAVELVVLAIWKKALDICSTWSLPISKGELNGRSSINESIIASGDASLSQTMEQKINFSDHSSVSLWAKHGFVIAVDRAEKLSCHIQNMDGAVEMPDAMDIIFQQALLVGTNAAVDEYMNNKDKSAESYSKAMLLLSFIVGEAENLPLNPPFSLLADDQKRIVQYICNLQFHKKSLTESASRESHTLP